MTVLLCISPDITHRMYLSLISSLKFVITLQGRIFVMLLQDETPEHQPFIFAI